MSSPTRTVKFLQERMVFDHDNNLLDHFKVGDVKELPAASASRWVRRQVAEYYVPPVQEVVEKKAEKPKLTKKPRRKPGAAKNDSSSSYAASAKSTYYGRGKDSSES